MENLLSYPIGKFIAKDSYTMEEVVEFINRIELLPTRMRLAVDGLPDHQLDTPYREGGWTLRQVVHHVADSHMNAYIRIKWTLSEEKPIIKAYEEKRWAETPETKLDPGISIELLKALHVKLVALAKRISAQELARQFVHPETKKEVRLDQLLGLYAWHGEHHLTHITSLKDRMGWK